VQYGVIDLAAGGSAAGSSDRSTAGSSGRVGYLKVRCRHDPRLTFAGLVMRERRRTTGAAALPLPCCCMH
jgi:hypothetical protein